jgi:CBS domain-containing protein
VSDFDFVHDFGEMENIQISEETRKQPISELMEQPVQVDSGCKLLRAAATMEQHSLRDLPIVDDENRLVGLASWVDVGTAFLRRWVD